MKIQSLSIVVPNNRCMNNCKFCCVKMSNSDYKCQLNENLPFYDLYLKDYIERMNFARDNGCNTVMLTGDSEPQQNRKFLEFFGMVNSKLDKPFRNIEIQTTGALLDEGYLRFLRNHVGVKTISLSVSSFDNKENNETIGTPSCAQIDLKHLCELIVKYDFNLRLSLNLVDNYNRYSADGIFKIVKSLGANQVTFRCMYSNDADTAENRYLKAHNCRRGLIDDIREYIKKNGRALEVMEFGATRYSVDGMSTVLDDDSMSTATKMELKYLILRPDCKLYSKWDDKGSIIF